MPELAEVQTVVDTLKGLIKDKCIRDIDIYYPRIIEGDIESFKKRFLSMEFWKVLQMGLNTAIKRRSFKQVKKKLLTPIPN